MSNETNNIPVYAEPEGVDYIIIKVKESVINGDRGGNLYETTRRAWRAKLETAMPYRYVLSVVGGVVQEVYSVSRWYTSPEYAPRIEFEGTVAEFNIRNLFVGKMIPECYRQKGLASPFLYKKKDGAPVAEPAPAENPEVEALKAAVRRKVEEAAIMAKAEADARAAAAAALAKAEAEAKAKAEAEAKAKAEAEAKAKAKAEAEAKAKAEAEAKAKAEAEAKAKAEAEAKAKAEAEAKAKAEAESKAKAEAEAKAKAEAEAKAKAEAEAKAKAEAEAKAKAGNVAKCEDNGDGRVVLKQGNNKLFFKINYGLAEVVSEYDGMWDEEPQGEITIPDAVSYDGKIFKVTRIARLAFANCTKLTKVNLSNNIANIEEKAFYACKGLQSIDFKNVTTIGQSAFQGCTGLKSIDFKNVTTIGQSAFYGCTGLQSIDFKNVTTIGQSAFKECKGLTKVIIPSRVKEIPEEAFYDCEKIEKVIIPASVEKIGDYAFEYCYALGNVVIPNKQCSVGYNAFYGIKGQVIR